MRNSTAYFAGVATVFTATALGFGGAMFLTNPTAPRSSAEPAKLERSVASPPRASSSVETKPTADVTPAETTQSSNQAPAAPSPAPANRQPTQQATTAPQPSSEPQGQPQPAAQTTAAAAEQATADPQLKSPANAYARGSDEDVRKYIRKRERRWARRHYRDGDATTATQDADSSAPNTQSPSSVSSSQPAAQGQAKPLQIKTADQSSAKADDVDAGKAKRKHDRHWTRSYARDDDERARDEDHARSFESRRPAEDDAPQTFFGMPRWRPFLSDSDDD